ncbi:MAG TPA: mechanosensitive ion channel domain-containing protein, partial [Candidatus Binatia bacterium]|nr:mechanosensitive ion channel domain-containing protein [Candidatus Binatia bacterium]
MATSLTQVVGATFAFLVLVWLLRRIRLWALARLEKISFPPEKWLPGLAADFRPHIVQAAKAITGLLWAAAVLVLCYLWLVHALGQFPQSAPWAEQLKEFLIALFIDFAKGALGAVPGLVAVAIVFVVARWITRLVRIVFTRIEAGLLSLPWLERDTARTTQTLLIMVVWLFALVAAYPYIPGSETDAFKGLSVLLGLMVTLGSTGIINQIISGLFVVYSKSVRPADYVRVGDVEGEVIDVGFLATKLRTPRQEEITIPHSVLVGSATTNYSSLAGDNGMAVTTSVTIGYDVPWRQVHALLLLGAARTRGLRREPPPRVMQRELSDFYVQYLLLAHLENGLSRAAVLSDLHSQIQDAFNEFGTQIMSPHFESQPEKPVFVPRSAWHAAPAAPEEGSRDAA